MRTAGSLYSEDEIDQLASTKAFARAQGWTLVGAAVEPEGSDVRWKQVVQDFNSGKLQAVIVWDQELGYPGVWEDDLPVL